MKILHIGNELQWRGGENQIHLLLKGLAERRLGNHYVAYPVASKGYRRFSAEFLTLGLAHRSPRSPLNIWRLVQFCRKEKIEIIDAHSSGAHSLALAVCQLNPGIRLVVHRRVDNPLSSGLWTRRKYLNGRIHRFVAISKRIADILRDYGVDQDKISIVHSATEPWQGINKSEARQRWRQQLGLDESTFVFGNASALTEQKGYPTLFKAAKQLKDAGIAFHLIIAGEGHLQDSLESLARTLGVRAETSFLGFQSSVRELLCSFDVLAMPSNNEGLGTLALDAAWAEIPIVASRVGGLPEIIRDRETGWLVDKGNHQQLAARLIEIYHDRQIGKHLAQNAREYVGKNFDLSTMILGNWYVYQQVMEHVHV